MNEHAEVNYRLRLYPYSGGAVDLIEEGTLAECRSRAARIIFRHRTRLEYPVTVLERGCKWELETGDDAAMIGDGEGLLAIDTIRGEPEPDHDADETVTECECCGELIHESEAIHGLCPQCGDHFDDEEES